MKHMILLLIVSALALYGQGTTLDVYDYQLQVNTKLKNGRAALVALKPAASTKEESYFGYWLSSPANTSALFLEIKEGARTVASVTAKDFAAKAKYQTSGTRTAAVYTAGTGTAAMTITVESDVLADSSMPLGKIMNIDVTVKAAGNRTLSAVMSLFADGVVKKVGANGVSSSRMENKLAAPPYAVIIGNGGTAVTVDGAEQKTPGRTVKLSATGIASSGNAVTVLSFRAHSTTVKSLEKAVNQAVNLESKVTTKQDRTELSLINSASKQTPFPGDTITYTITYHNIGTAPAQDIVISNPIPVNTVYVEKSAAGDGAEITVERKKVNPPQIGEVTSVSWKITKRVQPGEEGNVSLKAVVR